MSSHFLSPCCDVHLRVVMSISVLWCPSPCCDVHYDFRVFVFTSICFVGGFCFIYMYLGMLGASDSLTRYIGDRHDFHFKWCSCRVTVTRRVSRVEQELLYIYPSGAPELIPEILQGSYYWIFRSLCCVLYHWLSFCSFSFGHCIVRPSSIYGIWWPLWCLHTFHENVDIKISAHDAFLE
jgi:hypothetical protein